jgi:hypothetical protein
MTKVQNAKDKIKQAWDENPMAVIGISAAAITAVAKIAQVAVEANNSRTWKKEVDRRVKNTK